MVKAALLTIYFLQQSPLQQLLPQLGQQVHLSPQQQQAACTTSIMIVFMVSSFEWNAVISCFSGKKFNLKTVEHDRKP